MFFVRLTYALWILQTAYLTVTSFNSKRDTRPHLAQSFGLMGALVAAGVLPRLRIFGFVNFAPINGLASSLGVVVCAGGMGVLVWARQTLGRNWSQTVAAKEDQELITSGAYRYVRHPMYAGGLLASVASAVVVGGPFVFASLLVGPLFLWRVRAEDRLMTQQFPEEYPRYMQRTKALIPFVW